jgi:hypothetical protein
VRARERERERERERGGGRERQRWSRTGERHFETAVEHDREKAAARKKHTAKEIHGDEGGWKLKLTVFVASGSCMLRP